MLNSTSLSEAPIRVERMCLNPFLSSHSLKLTEKLCEEHDFCLFVGTVGKFLDELRSVHSRMIDPSSLPLDDGLSGLGLESGERLRFSFTFEAVSQERPSTVNPARFLLGSEITWGMIAANADIPRDIYEDLRAKIAAAVPAPERLLLDSWINPAPERPLCLDVLLMTFHMGLMPYSGNI